MEKVTLGGNRLGAGKKMSVSMQGYGRSTHDTGSTWRSSMAFGTLVPFLNLLSVPGDSWDIKLNADVMTHPTLGPLFGSAKVQLDVFVCPIRLYIKALHNNETEIGRNIAQVKFPQLRLKAGSGNANAGKTNPSSLINYLGIKGVGRPTTAGIYQRDFNALPLFMYWDVYKNYYANKQEEIGAMIHTAIGGTTDIQNVRVQKADQEFEVVERYPTVGNIPLQLGDKLQFEYIQIPILQNLFLNTDKGAKPFTEVFGLGTGQGGVYTSGTVFSPILPLTIYNWGWAGDVPGSEGKPEVVTFDLKNIDLMRDAILTFPTGTPYVINPDFTPLPYSSCLQSQEDSDLENGLIRTCEFTQQGLGLKTYQSDIFNNWLKTEWIDGAGGINEITKVSTADGGFSIDALNLATKVYKMLNRVAVSGGSYFDYLEAVYDTELYKMASTPIYVGGLSKELVFQEVISNASTETNQGEQPLGQLAGRGVMADKHKGGTISIKVKEPSYIMGIISVTPRVDYSQGNRWDTNLKDMQDLHVPELDEIGFQDLVTDKMAFFDTTVEPDGTVHYNSAGKQPAWIDYMTDYPETFGNFAIPENEMFMTFNRRYEQSEDGLSGIEDLTTYIDPSKHNFIFAETALDAQNLWVQVSKNVDVRRVMSAKVMPNL